MATKLPPGKRLQRQITLPEVGDVVLTIDSLGFTFRVPGTQLGVGIGWWTALKHCNTPLSGPSYLFGNALKFLQHQAAKKQK